MNKSPAKIGPYDQHNLLHLEFPSDCCLCKAEKRIRDLETRMAQLEGLLIQAGLKGVLDKLKEKGSDD